MSRSVVPSRTHHVALALALAACGSDPSGPEGGVDADQTELRRCGASERVVFVTSDFTTGAAGLLDLSDWTSQPSLITLHADAVVTCHCGAVVVLERLGGDNVTLLSPEGLSLIGQLSLGPRSNPYDLVLEGDRAFATLYGTGELVEVDLDSGERLAAVDLRPLADGDGNPEAAMLYRRGDTLYVTLQLLDEGPTLWEPTGPGRLAVVGLDPFELRGTIALEGHNPATDIIEGEAEGLVYIGHAGTWADPDDGGIERVDLDAGRSEGLIATAADLGGNVIDLAIVDAELGFVTVNVPGAQDRLLAFDPSTGAVTAELAASTAYSLVDLLLDGEGRLIVTDRAPMASGLRVFDVETFEELTSGPIATGIPPFSLCLLPEPE